MSRLQLKVWIGRSLNVVLYQKVDTEDFMLQCGHSLFFIDFADPPPPVAGPEIDDKNSSSFSDEPIIPEQDPPTTLLEWAVLILNTPHPTLKVARTRHAANLFFTGQLPSIGHKKVRQDTSYASPPDMPKREKSMLFVNPTETKNNRKKNRAVMLHALACIEQWA